MLASLWLWRIRDDREIFDIVNFKMYDFSRNSRMFVHRRALYAFMIRDVKNEMSKANRRFPNLFRDTVIMFVRWENSFFVSVVHPVDIRLANQTIHYLRNFYSHQWRFSNC